MFCKIDCVQCNTAQVCTSCNQGYFAQATACVRCQANCQVCVDASSCRECSTGFYLLQTKTDGQLKIESCAACPAGATTCPNNSPTACEQGYFLAGGRCVFCSNELCVECASTITCKTCLPRYYAGTDGACTQCPANCYSCTSGSACTLCLPGFQLSSGNCQTACPTGIFSVADNSCLACAANCLVCSLVGSAPVCATCMTGFFKSGTSCLSGGSVLCRFSNGYGLGQCNPTSCYPEATRPISQVLQARASIEYCLPRLYFQRNPQQMLTAKWYSISQYNSLRTCEYYLVSKGTGPTTLDLSTFFTLSPSYALTFRIQLYFEGIGTSVNSLNVQFDLLNEASGQAVDKLPAAALAVNVQPFKRTACAGVASQIAMVTV